MIIFYDSFNYDKIMITLYRVNNKIFIIILSIIYNVIMYVRIIIMREMKSFHVISV